MGYTELLRQYFQDKSEEIAGEESLKRQYCSGLVGVSQEIPQTPTLEQIEAVALSIPHLKEVATELQQWLEEEDRAWPFVGLGRFYEGQGFYQDAEPCVQRMPGCDSPHARGRSTLTWHPASITWQRCIYNQGRYSEAEPLYQQALELYKRLLGEEHPDVAKQPQ